MELLRIGERVRRVFLNPSRKVSLLFVGLGVRGCTHSNPPVCERCNGWLLWSLPLSRFVDPETISVGGTDTVARTGSDVVVVVAVTVTRLYASKSKMKSKTQYYVSRLAHFDTPAASRLNDKKQRKTFFRVSRRVGF